MFSPSGLLPWALTASAVIGGPSLLAAAQQAPTLTLSSVALAFSAIVVALSLAPAWRPARVAAAALPSRRPPRLSLP